MQIGKTFQFEAAHCLEDWPEGHQCRRLHGHSYKVEVVIEGDVDEEGEHPGAILDFGILSQIWKRDFHSRLDHQNLNEVLKIRNTTAETLCVWLFAELEKALVAWGKGCYLKMVRVWETESSYAEYSI